jgi:hypothetical protein
MTALATMLALVPLAVIKSGGAGGAFISAPLAIVVIGGLFTSTILTLVLVPVLYSLASGFTGTRSSTDLDALLDAAEDRRFKPLGLRGAAPVDYAVTLVLEPEPGNAGDGRVLQTLTQEGFQLAAVPGTAKVRVEALATGVASEQDARQTILERIQRLIPPTGYRLSEPEARPAQDGSQAA